MSVRMPSQGARPAAERLNELRRRTALTLTVSVAAGILGAALLAAPTLAGSRMDVALLVAGAACLAAAIAVFSVWQTMRRRTVAIEARLSGEATLDPAAKRFKGQGGALKPKRQKLVLAYALCGVAALLLGYWSYQSWSRPAVSDVRQIWEDVAAAPMTVAASGADGAPATNETSVAAGPKPMEAKTSLQCQIDVNARYDSLRARADNATAAPDFAARRTDELRACEKIDRLADEKLFSQADVRLDKFLEKVRAGKRLTPEEKAELEMDYKAISSARDLAARHAYLNKAAELYERLNTSSTNTGRNLYPQLSCADYAAKLKELAAEDLDNGEQLARLKRPDGSIVDEGRWASLTQKRTTRQADLKFFSEGAKANSCKI